ncbi:uncharacterized protein LOC118505313 [Anopheles stephensi]|uniref:uncharacterized protein LOC118505313 n=1 Tax=Anopheles stephensi TaxID=30069 RepID=UPI00165894BA|nr:uncharacterized protein LOC118505313 [Anopheles stephensi]
MAEVCTSDHPEECVIELECTENSQPFETHTVTIVAGGEKLIGRNHKKKHTASKEEINILFDNRILSQAHATLLFKEGKLYLKDLCSANGTYLNGNYIGPNNQDQHEPVARQLKTGDVLGFGKLRVTRVNSDVIKPIEAKLTIKSPQMPSEENDHLENNEMYRTNYTPFEGKELDQAKMLVSELMKPASPTAIDKVVKRSGKIKSMKALEQETQSEPVKLHSTSTQTLQEAERDAGEKESKSECECCDSVSEEFYRYRKRALMAIVICLLIITIYQQYLSF